MNQRLLADKYTQALYNSLEKNEQSPVLIHLSQIIASILQNHNVWTLIQSPVCGTDDVVGILETMLKNTAPHEKLVNFLKLIVRRKRLSLLPQFKTSIEHLLKQHNNVASVTISTPLKLEEAGQKALLAYLKSKSGKSLDVTYCEESDLLGGFKAQVDHVLYDGSLKATLSHYKEAITSQ